MLWILTFASLNGGGGTGGLPSLEACLVQAAALYQTEAMLHSSGACSDGHHLVRFDADTIGALLASYKVVRHDTQR